MRIFARFKTNFLLFILGLTSVCHADEPYPLFNMHRGVTPLSHQIYDLHMTIFLICVAIAVIVFGFLIFALIFHRKARGVTPANFHEHPWLEIGWAIVPFIILLAMAIPATKGVLNISDTTDSELTIKITGYQWKWRYEYLDQGLNYFSNLATPFDQIYNKAPKDEWYLLQVDAPLVLPINKKIRFLVTANDVIHSWWVPDLGIKRDGVPGFLNETWAYITKPGTYRGQCAELCGVFHGYMPIVVIAKTEEEFQQWVITSKQKLGEGTLQPAINMSLNDLMKLGESAYNKNCAACHQTNGKGLPPLYPPLKSSSIAVGRPKSRHVDIVLLGVPGTSMQAFGPQLTDEELAAIITYERNAWDNNTGELIQPSEIKTEREIVKKSPPVIVPRDQQLQQKVQPQTS